MPSACDKKLAKQPKIAPSVVRHYVRLQNCRFELNLHAKPSKGVQAMNDVYSTDLGPVSGESGTIIVNEYAPKGVGTGHVNLTYVFADGSNVTYGNNTSLGSPNFAGGVHIEDGTLAAGLADGSVTRHPYPVDEAHFYASLQDVQHLAAEAASGQGSYDIYGQNCVDTLRRETQIAGLPDPADILTAPTAVTYYAQHTTSLAGVALMDVQLGIPLDIGIPAYLAGAQIGNAINGLSDLVDAALNLPVGMQPLLGNNHPAFLSDNIMVTPDYGANAVILSTDATSILQFVNDSNVFQIPPDLYQGDLLGVPNVVMVDMAEAVGPVPDITLAELDFSLYGDGWGGYGNWGGHVFVGF
jgi:hypothetical protein